RHAGDGAADEAGARVEAVALGRLLGGDDDRRRAVVDAGRVARRHGAVGADDRPQFGQSLDAGLARMLVAVDDHRIALALGDLDGDDLRVEAAAGLRRRRLGLAPYGEGVLVGAADLEV